MLGHLVWSVILKKDESFYVASITTFTTIPGYCFDKTSKDNNYCKNVVYLCYMLANAPILQKSLSFKGYTRSAFSFKDLFVILWYVHPMCGYTNKYIRKLCERILNLEIFSLCTLNLILFEVSFLALGRFCRRRWRFCFGRRNFGRFFFHQIFIVLLVRIN